MQLLQPPAILHVAFTARHVLGASGIDQQHLKARFFERLEQRNPVDARRFHRHGFNPAAFEPLHQLIQLGGVSAKAAHRGLGPPFGHGHVMDPRAHIDAGRIGIFNGQIGPSPVAFAGRALANAGLALRSRALRGGSWGLGVGVPWAWA